MKKQIGKFRYGKAYLTAQLYVVLLMATFFSLILCGAVKFLLDDNTFSFFVMGVVTLSLNGGMVYQAMWRQGDKESNYIQFKRMEKEPFKGLKVGLLIMIPYIILGVILGLSVFSVVDFEFLRVYRIINAPLYGFMKLIKPDLYGVTVVEYVALVLLPFVYLVFCTAGYELGLRHISIKERLVYKH